MASTPAESGAMVVTGGTDGIGRATALHLARAGFPVIFTGRSRTRAESALRELRGAGPGLSHAFVRADFSLLEQVRRAADEILAQAPRIRGLVHCAGIIANRAELTLEGIETNFAVNYLSRYLLTPRASLISFRSILESTPLGALCASQSGCPTGLASTLPARHVPPALSSDFVEDEPGSL